MLTKVQERGDSLALRIPKTIAVDARIENDSIVEILVIDGQIVVKPVVAPKWTLDEFVAGVNVNTSRQETDTSLALGNEAW